MEKWDDLPEWEKYISTNLWFNLPYPLPSNSDEYIFDWNDPNIQSDEDMQKIKDGCVLPQ